MDTISGGIFLGPSSISVYKYDVISVPELSDLGSGFLRCHQNFSFAKMQFRMTEPPYTRSTKLGRPKHART